MLARRVKRLEQVRRHRGHVDVTRLRADLIEKLCTIQERAAQAGTEQEEAQAWAKIQERLSHPDPRLVAWLGSQSTD